MTADTPESGRSGVSIVCVFNDLDVRKDCLDRSISRYGGRLNVDYLPVDNRDRQFSTAGAALNFGAAQARHELVVLLHQDVYLHSIDRLAAAGDALFDGDWAMLGASGVTSEGVVAGRLRDRIEIVGQRATTPIEVDSLDEVLFMVSRGALAAKPLSEDPDLAWHAYAVEYACRLRADGAKVGAVDVAITHNSLTVNLDRLDVAHRVVGDHHPGLRPIHTTCGTIRERTVSVKDLPIVRDHRWRLRWLRNSLLARRIPGTDQATVVLADIRHDVDLLSFGPGDPLQVVNVDETGECAHFGPGWLRLTRKGKPVDFTAVGSGDDLATTLAGIPTDANLLVTGLDDHLVTRLCRSEIEPRRSWVIGIQSGPHWALAGPVTEQLPESWRRAPSVPLGAPRRLRGGAIASR